MVSSESTEEVRIRFTTRLEDELLKGATGVELVVPGSATRRGLNEILKHLLDLSDENDVEGAERLVFDFLVLGRLLRLENLKKLCDDKGLSSERVVEVEYTLRTTKSKAEEECVPLEDWICSIDGHPEETERTLVGTYSGIVKVLQKDNVVSELKASEGAVKSVRWIGGDRFLCGGADGVARIFEWKGEGNDPRNYRCILTGAGTDGAAIESVEIIGDGDRIAVGSFVGGVYILETSKEANETLLEIRNVKRRRADTEAIAAVPSRELEGHTLAVSALSWQAEEPSSLISGSWDGTVCFWDIEAGQRTRSVPIMSKAVTDISVNGQLVAAACTDGAVRLLDHRIDAANGTVMSIRRAHKGFVSGVQWRPESMHDIASSGYDSSVRLWDIRAVSGTSFKRLGAHGDDGKATCLNWQTVNDLVSGGSDGQLRFYHFH